MSINRLYPEEEKARQKSQLIGVGLDNKDGHKRVTQAEDFWVVGGSQDTHERMTETLVKTFEDLKRVGKCLEYTDPEELAEIISRNSQ